MLTHKVNLPVPLCFCCLFVCLFVYLGGYACKSFHVMERPRNTELSEKIVCYCSLIVQGYGKGKRGREHTVSTKCTNKDLFPQTFLDIKRFALQK